MNEPDQFHIRDKTSKTFQFRSNSFRQFLPELELRKINASQWWQLPECHSMLKVIAKHSGMVVVKWRHVLWMANEFCEISAGKVKHFYLYENTMRHNVQKFCFLLSDILWFILAGSISGGNMVQNLNQNEAPEQKVKKKTCFAIYVIVS